MNSEGANEAGAGAKLKIWTPEEYEHQRLLNLGGDFQTNLERASWRIWNAVAEGEQGFAFSGFPNYGPPPTSDIRSVLTREFAKNGWILTWKVAWFSGSCTVKMADASMLGGELSLTLEEEGRLSLAGAEDVPPLTREDAPLVRPRQDNMVTGAYLIALGVVLLFISYAPLGCITLALGAWALSRRRIG